ncbi:MarR family transcriptional regulator [Halobacillus shinanisalinarum]|uniref:HTH-type transcriptional regulator n=1 Tax=Halobacillus shinanisalinarum TaxID=2932258 RepID=A0ABY4GXI3_9BACI|nr:MarR family transcriptional regulator [Halobacillus shinanisalinarum]UOQ92764.1 MarR family transcriptional regulator [Halobacillus shinanisalinarum]
MELYNHHTLEHLNTKVIQEFSKTLEMFGLSQGDARLFVTLYIHPTPMTLDEMSEALGKSKTSMSTGVRNLADQGLVERVWKKGFRKDLYQADENLYRKFMNSYTNKWLTASHEQMATLKSIDIQMEDDSNNTEQPCEVAQLKKRVDDMIRFHRLISEAFKEIQPNNSK